MGLLVGLPLKLLHIVFVFVRLMWPLLLIALILWVIRRKKGGGATVFRGGKREQGPVVEVDYEVVDSGEEKP